jgi:hypothetical protein
MHMSWIVFQSPVYAYIILSTIFLMWILCACIGLCGVGIMCLFSVAHGMLWRYGTYNQWGNQGYLGGKMYNIKWPSHVHVHVHPL